MIKSQYFFFFSLKKDFSFIIVKILFEKLKIIIIIY